MQDYANRTPSVVNPGELMTVQQATDAIRDYLSHYESEQQSDDFTQRGLTQFEAATGGFFTDGAEHDLMVAMAIPEFSGNELADDTDCLEAYITINRAYGKVVGADIALVYDDEELGTETVSASNLGEGVVMALKEAYEYRFGNSKQNGREEELAMENVELLDEISKDSHRFRAISTLIEKGGELVAEMQDFYCRHSDWKVIREMQITAIEKSDTDEVKVSGEGELCGRARTNKNRLVEAQWEITIVAESQAHPPSAAHLM